MDSNINYSKLIEIMEKTIERQETEIKRLEQENALLKAGSKHKEVNTFIHTGKFIAKTECDCIDWRDLQASPFCKKCNGTGSY